MTNLIIDSEFHDLIPPLSDEERAQLEENLLRDGIQDPLKVWQGTLIDGHNRYEIAQAHGLEFTTTEMQFASRDDVIIWIIKNQFGRRNLSAYDRSILALKLKPVIAAKAKERMEEGTNQYSSPVKNSCQGSDAKNSCPQAEETKEQPPQPTKTVREQKTDYQVAKAAGVSEDTIRKVEKIEAQATPEIKAALKSGDLSINAAYEGVKAGASTVDEVVAVKEAKKPHVYFNGGNNEWYTPAEFIDAARQVFGGTIDLDPASSEIANKTVKATKFFTAEDDGLSKIWEGNIWLNPPYSSGLIEKFIDKLICADFKQAIVLVNNSTDTEWFSRLTEKAAAVVFPKGRVKFLKPDGTPGAPLQGQVIVYLGSNVESFKKNFGRYGRCWQ